LLQASAEQVVPAVRAASSVRTQQHQSARPEAKQSPDFCLMLGFKATSFLRLTSQEIMGNSHESLNLRHGSNASDKRHMTSLP